MGFGLRIALGRPRLTFGLDTPTQAAHPKFVLHLSAAVETDPTARLVLWWRGKTSIALEG